VSLNEGGHQLRIYHGVPDASIPLCESCHDAQRMIPAASLLVRLLKKTANPQGEVS